MSSVSQILKDPAFIQSVIDTLLSNQSHSVLRKPRVTFHEVMERKKARLISEGYVLEPIDEGLFRILKPGEPKKPMDDFDYYADDILEEDTPSTFHRRDVFLTGGAVAAVILEKLKGIPAVINDIDLFYYQFTAKDNGSLYSDMYENMIEENFHFRIERVRERGLLNLVKIEPGEKFKWECVLNSFDLNYAKVGIVLAEKKLIFNQEFLDFIENRLVKVSEDSEDDFPLTTFIRGIHKAKDFKGSFYLGDSVRKYIISLRQTVFEEGVRSFKVVHDRNDLDDNCELVTKKRWEHWNKNPDMLLPWYSISGENEITLHPPKEAWFDFFTWIFAEEYQKMGSEYFWQNNYGTLSNYLCDNYEFFIKQNKTYFARMKLVFSANLFPTGREWATLFNAQEEKLDMFRHDFSLNTLNNVKEFLRTHESLKKLCFHLMYDCHYSVQETLEFIQYTKGQTLTYIGMIETMGAELFDPSIRTTNSVRSKAFGQVLKNKNYDEINALLSEFYKEDLVKNILIEPLHIGPFAMMVEEVCTVPRIKEEGLNMRHCVAGYSEKVRRKECRIFHIEVDGHKSTLEVGTKIVSYPERFVQSSKNSKANFEKYIEKQKMVERKNGVNALTVEIGATDLRARANPKNKISTVIYVEFQHKGPCNVRPNAKNLWVARKLLKYLNNYKSPLTVAGLGVSQNDYDLLDLIFD